MRELRLTKDEKHLFSSVKVAREALRQRAEELISEFLDIAKQAKVAGDYETASKSLMWLIEHLPAESDGSRVVDVSVDKKAPVVEPQHGPKIQIGIQLGGVKQKQLPTVEAKPVTKVLDGETTEG